MFFQTQSSGTLDEIARQNILAAFQVLNEHLSVILQADKKEDWAIEVEKMGVFSQKIKRWLDEEAFTREYQAQYAQLTKQEKKILTLIAEGKSNREVGELLFISELTVETHRKNIKQKTGLQTTAEMIGFAYKFGMI